jgi:hypothetical protein
MQGSAFNNIIHETVQVYTAWPNMSGDSRCGNVNSHRSFVVLALYTSLVLLLEPGNTDNSFYWTHLESETEYSLQNVVF